jgi:signal peptidase I
MNHSRKKGPSQRTIWNKTNAQFFQRREYFCIGDNPNNSEDSRSANIGPVDEDDIVGKAWFHLKSSTEGMGFIK